MGLPLCGWFSNMETNAKAIFLSRLCWLLSFALVWVGLLTEGWQLVKFQGPGIANSIRENVYYGLWRIKYTGTYTHTSDYIDWEPEATDADETAFPRVQATRACVVLALMALCLQFLVALCLQFLVALRGYCARSEKMQWACTIICATCASADLVLTLFAILVWKSIPEVAFHVLCSANGCNVSPFGGDAFQMTPSYAWGFFIVKFILAFPGVVSLIYLCVPSSSSSEAATEMPVATAVKDSGAAGAAPKKAGKKGKKEAVVEKAEDDTMIAQEEGNRGGSSPKTNDSAGSAGSKKKGGGKGGGEAFDRDAPVSYVAGAAGDPNPAWLKS